MIILGLARLLEIGTRRHHQPPQDASTAVSVLAPFAGFGIVDKPFTWPAKNICEVFPRRKKKHQSHYNSFSGCQQGMGVAVTSLPAATPPASSAQP